MKHLLGVCLVLSFLALLIIGATNNIRIMQDSRLGTTGGNVIENGPCNVAQWTGWILVSSMGAVHFGVDFDETDADGTTIAVTMRCETHNDNTTANDAGRDLPGSDGGTYAAGPPDTLTLNHGTAIWNWTLAAAGPNDASWSWTVNNIPDAYINCLYTCTGAPDVDDDLAVWARGSTP